MLALLLVFPFAFILLSLITHIYYSCLFLRPTLKFTCGPEIEEFLTDLAVKRQVSAWTQNQALNAAVFLFKHIVGKEPGEFKAVRGKQQGYLPVVLSQAEVQRVLDAVDGVTRLMAEVMYGGGYGAGFHFPLVSYRRTAVGRPTAFAGGWAGLRNPRTGDARPSGHRRGVLTAAARGRAPVAAGWPTNPSAS